MVAYTCGSVCASLFLSLYAYIYIYIYIFIYLFIYVCVYIYIYIRARGGGVAPIPARPRGWWLAIENSILLRIVRRRLPSAWWHIHMCVSVSVYA